MSFWNNIGRLALFSAVCDMFSSKSRRDCVREELFCDDNYNEDYHALYDSDDIDLSDIEALQNRVDELESLLDGTDELSDYYDELQDRIDEFRDRIDCLEEWEDIQDNLDDLQDEYDDLDRDLYDDDDRY